MSIRPWFVSGLSALAVIGSLAACGGVATEPQELVNARAAYASASSGSARTIAPVELDQARLALLSAENAYHQSPRSSTVRDLAYVAQRRAEEADAVANARLSEQERAERAAAQARAQAQQLQSTRSALAATQARLAAEQARAEADRAALEREQAAHAQTAETAQAAIESLRQLGAVREERRGLVITLSGQVLFNTGEATLLPFAQVKLREVAAMLRDLPNRTIEVEGHTDARGRESENMTLSLERAQAVRNFLVANGVDTDRVRASGYGSSQPVATNQTPDGRAENRRVEIVLEPPAGGAPSMGGGPAGTP